MTCNKLNWKPAKIGCHWFASIEKPRGFKRFAISTFSRTTHDGLGVQPYPDSGYVLYCNCDEIGRFRSLNAAQSAAERKA